MAARHLGGQGIPADRAANALDLVGRDGFSIARAAQNDASVIVAGCNRVGGREHKVRVVARGIAEGAKVFDLVTLRRQECLDLLFVLEARMVCADGDFHGCFLFGVGLDPVISRKKLMETKIPSSLTDIQTRADALGFDMNSGMQVGQFLASLAASKPRGLILELGTGCGLGAAWLLSGMDAQSHLVSVDTDEGPQGIARDVLGADARVTFVLEDGGAVLERTEAGSYDLIFADAWPGKFSHLDEALAALKPGGIYLVDDLLPQPNWPDGHQANVDAYLDDLRGRDEFAFTRMDWATGVVMLVKR